MARCDTAVVQRALSDPGDDRMGAEFAVIQFSSDYGLLQYR